MPHYRNPIKLGAFLVSILALSACSESQSNAPAAPAMPPTQVKVVEVKAEPLPITNELPGRVAATRVAEVRPRVAGIIVERVFQQGSFVEKGDVLYRIDDASFQVQVQSSEATLRRAKAAQLQATQLADRQQELRQRNIASAQQMDNAVAALEQADADVAAAEAGLAAAQLNLDYALVRAPIAGRIGSALITEGALVSSAENLATIQQLDPVYVDFTQPSAEMMRLRRALEQGMLESPGPDQASVQLLLDDGSDYEHSGTLLFSESTVDPTTGQVTMRAEVPNPKGDLLPGLYVRVRIEQAIERSALAVPQQSIQRDAGGLSQVYVVNAENIPELRRVKVGREIGNRITILEGLSAGEKVVAEGFQKIRPGAPVDPQQWQVETAPADDDTATAG